MSLSEPWLDIGVPSNSSTDFPMRSMASRSLAPSLWLQLEGGWWNCSNSIARFAPGCQGSLYHLDSEILHLSPTMPRHCLPHRLCHLHRCWAAPAQNREALCMFFLLVWQLPSASVWFPWDGRGGPTSNARTARRSDIQLCNHWWAKSD